MNDPILAAYAALHAQPDKDEHRRYKGDDQHLCIGIGCTRWINDDLPSVLCPVCLIRVRQSRGLHGDGTPYNEWPSRHPRRSTGGKAGG